MIYDPFSDQARTDPYCMYASLREEHPAFWSPERSLWALSRHDDVSSALRDWRTYSSAQGVTRPGDLMDMDPPTHGRIRALLMPRLRATAMGPLEGFARASAGRILGRRRDGEIDLAREFAQRLPILVICHVLGLAGEDVATVEELAIQLIWGDAAEPASTRMRVRAALVDLFLGRVEDRLTGRHTDDLLGDLAQAVSRDDVSPADVAGLCLMLLVAAVEPTASLLSNVIHALGTSTVRGEEIVDTAGRVRRGAISEFLRHDPPVQWVSRVATRAVPLQSNVIGPGQRVLLLIGSANRDPRRYERPDTFDAERSAAHGITFGAGVHACPGMSLARLQATIGAQALAARQDKLSLAGPAVRSASHVLRGFDRLPVCFT